MYINVNLCKLLMHICMNYLIHEAFMKPLRSVLMLFHHHIINESLMLKHIHKIIIDQAKLITKII